MNQPPTSPTSTNPPPNDEPLLQGEGNAAVARRYRESVKRFIESHKAGMAAAGAAAKDAAATEALRDAEAEGRARARD